MVARAFGERELGVDRGEVFAHHEVDADAYVVGFLPRFGQEDHIAVERHARRLSSSMVIRFAASTGLSSLVPRPQM